MPPTNAIDWSTYALHYKNEQEIANMIKLFKGESKVNRNREGNTTNLNKKTIKTTKSSRDNVTITFI
jgi:hypothetical protein